MSESHSTSYVCPRATEESNTARRAFAATREKKVLRYSTAHVNTRFIVADVVTMIPRRKGDWLDNAKKLLYDQVQKPSSVGPNL